MAHTLRLPPELSIYTVGDLRTDWLTWLANVSDDVEIAGGEVDQVDGAGVQLLVSLHRAVRQRGLGWRLFPASASLMSACSAIGAREVLVDNSQTPEAP